MYNIDMYIYTYMGLIPSSPSLKMKEGKVDKLLLVAQSCFVCLCFWLSSRAKNQQKTQGFVPKNRGFSVLLERTTDSKLVPKWFYCLVLLFVW